MSSCSREGPSWAALLPAAALAAPTAPTAPEPVAAAALLYSQGATSASSVEQVLKRSVTRFPARSSRYARYTVSDGRENYRLYDLNCTASGCGAGILDIARFTTGTGGTPTVGRTVSAEGWQTSRDDVAFECSRLTSRRW